MCVFILTRRGAQVAPALFKEDRLTTADSSQRSRRIGHLSRVFPPRDVLSSLHGILFAEPNPTGSRPRDLHCNITETPREGTKKGAIREARRGQETQKGGVGARKQQERVEEREESASESDGSE